MKQKFINLCIYIEYLLCKGLASEANNLEAASVRLHSRTGVTVAVDCLDRQKTDFEVRFQVEILPVR